MALKLNYSSFDFETIKRDIISLMENDPVFKDYNFAGSNINTIIELLSGVADLFNYYINAVANESFIDSATLYENINKLSNLVGYNPGGYKSSTLTVSLAATITVAADDDYFTIPKWTTFTVSSTSPEGETIYYANPSLLTYIGFAGVNNFSDDLYLIQGISKTEPFSGTGDPFQRFEVSDPNAIEEYLEVTVNGVPWTKTDNLYRGVGETSKVFSTRYEKNELVEIRFGDGVFGVIPPEFSTIEVTFISSLGEDGQIGANEITGMSTEIQMKDNTTSNPIGDAITFTITQPDASDGGRIPLTSEQVADYAPRSFRTQDRAVSQQDHEDILLSEFNEFIMQSITLNSDDYFTMTGESPVTSGYYYNNVYLYILPRHGNELTGNLRLEVLNFMEEYKMATINYVLKNLDYRQMDVAVTYKKQADSIKTNTEISTSIESTVRSFFQRANRAIGEETRYSELLSNLHSLTGISSLTMSFSSDTESGWKHENIQFGKIQFPNLSGLTIASCGIGE